MILVLNDSLYLDVLTSKSTELKSSVDFQSSRLTRIPDHFRRQIFYSVLVFHPHVNGVFGHKKPQIFEEESQSEDFCKTPDYRFCVDGRKGRFLITMMSYIIERTLCTGQRVVFASL